jgi:hypothetical protein
METESHPIAGVDYPRTFQEMEQWFRDEAACRDYIRRLRWPEGFFCPHCGVSGEPWLMSDELLRCCSCRARTSFTAGTIFEGTRKPLRTWFMAMWFVTSQKNGVSALGLQRVLGLGSYETAWTWLHKLRRAMVRPGRERLSGTVEVDETYVGGPEKDKWGREVESKAIIAIGAEEDGKGVGRIRLRRIADVSAESLLPFVREAVVPGAHVHTDGWKGYVGLGKAGFKHRVSVITASADQPTWSCRGCIASPPCSSAGCSARTRAASRRTSSTTTSTSSPSASTGAGRRRGGYCSIASPSRP